MLQKKRKNPAQLILAAVIVLLMAAVFMFSSQNADESASVSKGVTYTAVRLMIEDYDSYPEPLRQQLVDIAHPTVRKAAHFMAFMAIGAAAFFFALTLEYKRPKKYVICFLVCVLYAVLDELHQLLSPGRACQLSDVFIDSLGSLTGMLLAGCVCLIAVGARNVIQKEKDNKDSRDVEDTSVDKTENNKSEVAG